MVWNDQKDELLCRKILLLELDKFKARAREKGNLWMTIADNLNSLDRFKADARAVRECYGVIKANFEAKEKEEKMAYVINPEVTTLDTALEEVIEREREFAKNFEVEDKKAKEDQELARSIRQEAVETFAETRAGNWTKTKRRQGQVQEKIPEVLVVKPLLILKRKSKKKQN